MTNFENELFNGLEDVFAKALEYCEDPHKYSELVGEWNTIVERINKALKGFVEDVQDELGNEQSSDNNQCFFGVNDDGSVIFIAPDGTVGITKCPEKTLNFEDVFPDTDKEEK